MTLEAWYILVRVGRGCCLAVGVDLGLFEV